ncbi:CHRD domain-containing protein [Planosporangium mesophilum]|uniref:CHRD domain-containing protein n=1 Tax=Planosporangium mesophilum TaxID=689768 RepID=A0A8J3TII4_9ACTN|nr:CHRD domain-containing protein [Planosporangium mesophilum]NJC83730.1 CHRD domain-containing protein [Planosporangium mesophilum]GII26311.1 hypothetical protein Pme01_59080 [Planosporangium mesophilum]
MFRTVRSRLVLSIAAATAAGLAVPGAAPAHGPHPQQSAVGVTRLVAALEGGNEVPGPAGSPAVGDPDGRAFETLRIEGNQVRFTIRWTGIGAPTAAHLHLGAAGTNGPLKVVLFSGPLPTTLTAVSGSVTVDDQTLLDSLASDPGAFYTNLHSAEFPGGAARGQLRNVTAIS